MGGGLGTNASSDVPRWPAQTARLARAGRASLDLIYPPRCPVTDEAVTRHGAFSGAAWGRTRMISAPQCEACGLPFALTDPAAPRCAPCAAPARFPGGLTGPRRLDRVRSALGYDDEAARLVVGLKYGDRHDQVPALARLMAMAGDVLLEREVVLVPVPLHRRRLAARRFNQAALLSGALAGLTGQAHAPLMLTRTKATPKQKGLSARGRRMNVASAFAVRRGQSAKGARVVLIDDVLTTGATLTACARILRGAGALSVEALTLARVLKQ